MVGIGPLGERFGDVSNDFPLCSLPYYQWIIEPCLDLSSQTQDGFYQSPLASPHCNVAVYVYIDYGAAPCTACMVPVFIDYCIFHIQRRRGLVEACVLSLFNLSTIHYYTVVIVPSA